MRRGSLAWALLLTACAAATHGATARVCELTLATFVDGKHDLRAFLFHRRGRFYHGFARVVGRDELPHRLDPAPAAPFRLVGMDGKEIQYPPSDGVYAYHTKEYKRLATLYREEVVKAQSTDAPQAIAWDGKSLSGTLDVWVLAPDGVNHWGLEPKEEIRPFRIVVAASADGEGTLAGSFEAWTYAVRDRTYGKGARRFKGTLTGRWRDDFWDAQPGTEFPSGSDWPSARGPGLDGSAVDCEAPLVDSLSDARLLWVAEEMLPGGKGGGPKVAFHYTPANWASMGDGAYGGPVVADGKVYLYLRYPDVARLEAMPEARSHILTIRGAPIGRVASEFAALLDCVLCIEARTGKTLWKQTYPLTGLKNPPSGKSGKGLTPCIHAGRLFVRGHKGIYCFDAQTGQLLWRRSGRDRKDRSYGVTGGWSRDLSPVVIGGTLVFHIYPDTTLVGLDPATGSERWRLEKVCGWDAVPTKVLLGGQEHIITAYGVDVRTTDAADAERMVLIQPQTGTIVWQTDQMGKTGVALAVSGDLVCGNVVRGLSSGEGKGVDEKMRAGGFRVSRQGAARLWTADRVHYPPHRATPIAHRGHFYIDSRITGFNCIEAATGTVVSTHKHIHEITGGDHNWTWHVATNGRILTSGVLMFSSADQGFKQMQGRLPVSLVSGYMCPVKPAIADGRLFLRTLDKLVCYDLRRRKP